MPRSRSTRPSPPAPAPNRAPVMAVSEVQRASASGRATLERAPLAGARQRRARRPAALGAVRMDRPPQRRHWTAPSDVRRQFRGTPGDRPDHRQFQEGANRSVSLGDSIAELARPNAANSIDSAEPAPASGGLPVDQVVVSARRRKPPGSAPQHRPVERTDDAAAQHRGWCCSPFIMGLMKSRRRTPALPVRVSAEINVHKVGRFTPPAHCPRSVGLVEATQLRDVGGPVSAADNGGRPPIGLSLRKFS